MTALQAAVAKYEQGMLALAQGHREDPRTLDYMGDTARAAGKRREAQVLIDEAKVEIATAIAALKDNVERAAAGN